MEKSLKNYISTYRKESLKDTLIFIMEAGLLNEYEINDQLSSIEKGILYQEYLYNHLIKVNRNRVNRSILLIEFNIFKGGEA